MSIEEIKHIDELGKASRIIKELGYEPDESMCDDRPDIVLPSKTDIPRMMTKQEEISCFHQMSRGSLPHRELMGSTSALGCP